MQYRLAEQFLVPFLRDHGALPTTGRVLEVGPSEAGCLAFLHEVTKLPGDGIELSSERFFVARAINDALSDGSLALFVGDITNRASLASLTPPYTLILLRDVIEHIEAQNREGALRNCMELLAPGGHILFTFPPYYSPFGAHQQILSSTLLRLPWLQLNPLFLPMVRFFERDKDKCREMESLARCALTVDGFEGEMAGLDAELVDKELFLSRPVFKLRYGLPVLRPRFVTDYRFARDWLVTGAWYLYRRR
jgi:SAM-dependent methyltransferase